MNKIFHIKVYIITGVFRACILYFPFNKLKNYMGNKNEESKRNITKNEYNEAVRIAMTIKRVVKYTPWESKCLVQSLTAQYFLNKKHISSTLYLGLSREEILNPDRKSTELIAHSWIRCGDYFVTGGNGQGFAVVAKFCK
ncbi:lasso peptide biosynthesis B2 protein [Clostridium sp. SM-530-WT-3G]|uniref:lasso peptide biosynthesis B2 protein n=1 Tax=Clostridium sp. SM-530-WT-3G TaxID=2725303 RepID=UPI00325BC9E6